MDRNKLYGIYIPSEEEIASNQRIPEFWEFPDIKASRLTITKPGVEISDTGVTRTQGVNYVTALNHLRVTWTKVAMVLQEEPGIFNSDKLTNISILLGRVRNQVNQHARRNVTKISPETQKLLSFMKEFEKSLDTLLHNNDYEWVKKQKKDKAVKAIREIAIDRRNVMRVIQRFAPLGFERTYLEKIREFMNYGKHSRKETIAELQKMLNWLPEKLNGHSREILSANWIDPFEYTTRVDQRRAHLKLLREESSTREIPTLQSRWHTVEYKKTPFPSIPDPIDEE